MCCMCYMFLTHWSLLPNPWILRWHVSCIKINLNKILRIYEHLLILLSLAMFHTISHQQWLHSADGMCVFLIRMTILAYVDHEFLFKIQNMTRKPAFYPREIHGFPVRNSPSIFHCHQGSTSSAVGLVVNAIPFLYLWACCACFTERPKVRSSNGTYHGHNMLNMLQHAATELCNSMMPICQPSWTLTPVDVLIDRPTILKVYQTFEASKHSCWFRGLLTG